VTTAGVADQAPSTVGVIVTEDVRGVIVGVAVAVSASCGDGESVGIAVSEAAVAGVRTTAAIGAGVIAAPATMPPGAALDGSRPDANASVTTTAQKTIAPAMITLWRAGFPPRRPVVSPSPSG
jgi:hypothetical protein